MKPKRLSGPRPEPVDALVHPRFSGLSTFMRLPHVPRSQELDIALIGIPFDGGTTYRSGPRFGPRHVREQSAIIRPWNPVLNVNPFSHWRIADCGDLSILLPILRAVHRKFGPVALVQFDAHNDTWKGYFGSPHSHGTPVRRAVEEGLLLEGSVLQVGLRGQVYSKDDFAFGRQHKFGVITAEELHRKGLAPVEKVLKHFRGKPLYLTLDIDVVDPAFAPGTGTPQVGGLSSFQILELVRCLKGQSFVGADLVEVSPPYDNGEITSLLAANLLYEMLCLF